MLKLAIYSLFSIILWSGPAFATDINLPLPDLHAYYSTLSSCLYDVKPHAAATGFTADGNYVTAHARGYVACGHSGRGSNLHYTYYCMELTWDLAGNFISGVTEPYVGCPVNNAGTSYSLPSGYEEYTVTLLDYGYIAEQYPVLVVP